MNLEKLVQTENVYQRQKHTITEFVKSYTFITSMLLMCIKIIHIMHILIL